LIVDGPVTAPCVQELNSLLDEKRMLCLPNGERLIVPKSLRIIFETDDMSGVSPSLLSRAGVLVMQSSDVGWKAVVKSFIKNLLNKQIPERLTSHISSLFDVYITSALDFLKQECKFNHLSVDMHSIISV